jgi:hypothetical protein
VQDALEQRSPHVSTETANEKRRWGRIPQAVDYSGLSRTSLYKLAGIHRGLFRKHGVATVVDFQMLDAILEAAPTAKLSNNAA